ncbi:MAG TPA: protein kinase [Archangium sp.]|uniref:serine/threonine protein kinase n=1 Tax=Archangium sp. TaxID=1872627 RepID=UPI002E3481F4|nr:protein kinase [Archangium sp.]HEX5753612.1 protein kinase [Archangium sp.]
MIALMRSKGLPAGTMIDGWKVVRALGSGGFGAVLLVEKDGKPFALKFALHREASCDDKRTHARTLRELAILLTMDHPNVIKPHGYGKYPDARKGNVFVVLDYVEGWTLAQWVERKHPTAKEIIRVFRKIAAALAYLHARGVLHRDLKLSNVLIRKSDGEPIIIDFGCAIHAHSEELTDVPIPPGTPRYQPPQVFRFARENKNKPGARYPFQVADELFALGVMLYEVLTEPRPTEEDGKPVLNSLREMPASPRVKNPRVPEALSDLVMDLLEREPEDRPESAEAVERELAELEEHKGQEYAAPIHPPSEQRAPPEDANLLQLPKTERRGLAARLALHVGALASRVLRWRKGLAIGGAVAAAVLAAALAFWPFQGEEHTPPAETRAPVVASAPSASPTTLPAPPAVPDSRAGTAPNASTPPTGQAVDSASAVPAAVQKEGSTVTTEKPDASKQPPTARAQKPQRGAHTAELLAWCKSFAIVGTVAAVAAGCPGAQVRPEPFECPAGAWELMDEKWKWGDDGVSVLLDDRYKAVGDSWLRSGPVVGVTLPDQTQQTRSKKPVPVGTRFIGHLWVVPEPSRSGKPGYVVVRYDRVEFPNGDKAPVCLLAGGDRTLPVEELKDGTGRVTGMEGRARPVYRWKLERPE